MDGLVADARSRTDGHRLRKRHSFFYFVKIRKPHSRGEGASRKARGRGFCVMAANIRSTS